MTDPDLVAALSAAKYLPVAPMRAALAEPDRIVGAVLDVLVRAGVDGDLSETESDLLFWGLHVLAAARDPRVCGPLLVLLRQDGETLDALLGDAVTETLARMVNGVFDGDAGPLIALLLDTTVDDAVRTELFASLTFLTHTGRISRDATHAFLVRFDDKRAAVEGDEAWLGWEEAIGLLGFRDLVPRVETARVDGRIDPDVSELDWFRKLLRDAESMPDALSRFDALRHATLDDPVAALAWTAEDYGKPVRNPFKHIGRNDPCPCGSGKKFKKCCLDSHPA